MEEPDKAPALFYYLDTFRKDLEPCPWSFPEPVSCSHPPSTSFSGLSLRDVPAILGSETSRRRFVS